MKRKRFTEEQIIMILKEHEAGMRVQDLVRNASSFIRLLLQENP